MHGEAYDIGAAKQCKATQAKALHCAQPQCNDLIEADLLL